MTCLCGPPRPAYSVLLLRYQAAARRLHQRARLAPQAAAASTPDDEARHLLVLDQTHAMSAYARGRHRAVYHPLGSRWVAGHAAANGAMYRVRPTWRRATAPVTGRLRHRLGAGALG